MAKDSACDKNVYKIDEMGRVELPREYRKLLDIKEGSRVDLGITEDKIIISKFLPMEKINDFKQPILKAISTVVDHDILLVDDKKVIASNKKKYIEKMLSSQCLELLYKREITIKKEDSNMIDIFQDLKVEFCCELIVPILKDNDLLGAIIVLAEENKCFDDDCIKVCKAFASFLSCMVN